MEFEYQCKYGKKTIKKISNIKLFFNSLLNSKSQGTTNWSMNNNFNNRTNNLSLSSLSLP